MLGIQKINPLNILSNVINNKYYLLLTGLSFHLIKPIIAIIKLKLYKSACA